MAFAVFMSGPIGRMLRVAVGAVLVVAGILQSGGGVVLIVVGAVLVLVGIANVCLIAPLLRLPFTGAAIRARAARTSG